MPHSCPRCRLTLIPLKTAEACERCGGVFLASAVADTVRRVFEEDSQDAAQEAAELSERVVRTAEAIDCPVCRAPMRRYRVGHHLEVDTCHEHGSWYDKGELARLRDALQRGEAARELSAAELAARSPKRRDVSVDAAPIPIDNSVQEKINALAREERRAEQRDEQLRHVLLPHSHGGRTHWLAADLLGDLLSLLR